MARAPRYLAPLALLLALAGCGSQSATAPPCPRPAILPDGADLSIFRPGGTGPADLMEQATITGISGSCKAGSADTTLVSVTVAFGARRGPAATGRTLMLPWFLAVMRGGEILDKKIFAARVDFPAGADVTQFQGPAIKLVLPTQKGVTAADYRVVTGLQLTPAQLAHNRAMLTGAGR